MYENCHEPCSLAVWGMCAYYRGMSHKCGMNTTKGLLDKLTYNRKHKGSTKGTNRDGNRLRGREIARKLMRERYIARELKRER